jgi:GDP-4-dehydro-6-deoxy-D-mannose reductase
MKVLVTGASGFTGTHLLNLLQSHGVEIFTHGPIPGICGKHFDTPVGDAAQLAKIVRDSSPDYVIHLAGIASAADFENFYAVNTLYAASLLRALELAGCKDTPTLLVGTSAEYGMISGDQLPITEKTLARPYNHYGISKAAQTEMGCAMAKQGWRLVMVRPFNIIGPGMGPHLAVQSFASQVVEIVKNRRAPVISTGNLNNSRDFVDVQEVVQIYWQLVQTEAAYGRVINICSGKPIQMSTVLDKLIQLADRSIEIKVDPTRFKPVDVPVHYGSPELLRSILGSSPSKPLEQTLAEIFDDLAARS